MIDVPRADVPRVGTLRNIIVDEADVAPANQPVAGVNGEIAAHGR
jgi:hypothetical protein